MIFKLYELNAIKSAFSVIEKKPYRQNGDRVNS